MPPEITDWLMIPRLSAVIINGMWPYMAVPLEFILGVVLMRTILDSLRGQTTNKKQ